MICKWCGERIDSGAHVCSHCGKELPPLSECGGFYNIMPEAKLAQVRAPKSGAAAQTAPAPEHPASASSSASAAKTEEALPERSASKKVPVILAVLLGLCLIGLAVALIALNNTKERLREAEAARPAVIPPVESRPQEPAGESRNGPRETEPIPGTDRPTDPAPPPVTELPDTEPITEETAGNTETNLPTETELVETQPTETEPVVTEPVVTEPIETEPVVTEPIETEPVVTEPIETEPPTEPPTEPDDMAEIRQQVLDLFWNGEVSFTFDCRSGLLTVEADQLEPDALAVLQKHLDWTWERAEKKPEGKFFNEHDALWTLSISVRGLDDEGIVPILLHIGRKTISGDHVILSANLDINNKLFGTASSIADYVWESKENQPDADWTRRSIPNETERPRSHMEGDLRDAVILDGQTQLFRVTCVRGSEITQNANAQTIILTNLSLDDFNSH